MADNLREHWIYSQKSQKLFVIFAMIAFISVCFNTPEKWDYVDRITIFLDICAGIVLAAEVIFKSWLQGLIKGDDAYLKSSSGIFDCLVASCIWFSVLAQSIEMSNRNPESNDHDHYDTTEVILTMIMRVPRSLGIFRVYRYFHSIAEGKMTAIVLRASQNLGGATLLLMFFILLYGILGIQMFGGFEYHCVTSDTDPENVTLQNLAIPDTTCSVEDSSMCPKTMKCMHVHLHKSKPVYGSFDNIAISIKTVYEAASQEGWVFLMYKSNDSYQNVLGYIYFISLIIFLAWLVKNVFIAVIIDTFAEIRVHLHNLWDNSGAHFSSPVTQELSTEGESWKLVAMEDANARSGVFQVWQRGLQSKFFHWVMVCAIIANVAILAFQPRNRAADGERNWDFFRLSELLFTIVFDLEAVMKICCMGVKSYLTSNLYEAFLALITTVNTILTYDFLRSMPVLRIIRLVKLSPSLERFVYKILGPTQKIGTLVAFTFSILIFMSCLSLQLFCFGGSKYFKNFPMAFLSIFQVLTQEGWIDVMHDVSSTASAPVQVLITMYFIGCHFFVTTVLLSLVVAVILDNLELKENSKLFKQLKLSEHSVDTKQKLPWRLRVFGLFPNRPQMVGISCRLPTEFQIPCIRDSYMRQFLESKRAGISTGLASTRAQVRAQFAPTSQVVESPALDSVIRSGLRLQFAGAAMSSDALMNLDLPHSTVKPIGLRRRHNDVNSTTRKRLLLSSHLERSATYSSIVEKCNEHRKSNKIVDSRNMCNGPLSVPVYSRSMAYERHSVRNNQKQSGPNVNYKVIHLKRQEAMLKRERQERELRENHPWFDTPLFVVGRESKLRKICQLIAFSKYKPGLKKNKTREHFIPSLLDLVGSVTYLDWVVILVTIASCGFLMMETPENRVNNSSLLYYAEIAFVICMTIELLLKLMAGGLYFAPNPVLKDLGGLMDLFIYVVSLIFLKTLSVSVPANGGGQFLLLLRGLRPLRIFRLVPHIRNVVFELICGFKDILMVAILEIALMFVFANFGVELFGGKLDACNDRTITTKENCTGIFFQAVWMSNSINIDDENPPGFMVPRVWTKPRNFNFDTIGSAMLTLFEVLSLKGWVEVRDILQERFQSSGFLLVSLTYIHVYVMLGSMVGLTLFIGVVVTNYNKNNGTALLTVDQRKWENLKCRLKIAQPLHLPPRPSDDIMRAKAYDLAQQNFFIHFMTGCIILQTMLLVVKWNTSEGEVHVDYLAKALVCFNGIFAIEIMIKWIGMTFTGMTTSWRNRYDLLVTAAGMVWAGLFCFVSKDPSVYTAGVVLIILRFISVCGKNSVLKMLMMTVTVSVYKSFFIIGAMFLLMLCYAFAGVVLFGTVKYGENINRHANFGSAPMAITILFRIVTGEDWNKIMHDCMAYRLDGQKWMHFNYVMQVIGMVIKPPKCTPADNYWETDCGNVLAARIYFCSFHVIISYIMLNVLVAIIMENFSLFYALDRDTPLNYSSLHTFQVLWHSLDVKGKGSISLDDARKLIILAGPLLPHDAQSDRTIRLLMFYELCYIGRQNSGLTGKVMDGKVYYTKEEYDTHFVSFHDVLMTIAYHTIDVKKSLQAEEMLMRESRVEEIRETVAKRLICDTILIYVNKKREEKNTNSASRQSKVNIVCSPSSVAESSKWEEENDSAEEGSDFPFSKAFRNRRVGTWKRPLEYFNGMTENPAPLKPSHETEVDRKVQPNALCAWWTDISNQ